MEQSPYTWARTGQDNVHIYTRANDKSGITVLATIDYSGQKLPLVFIAKGKTQQCEKSQIGFYNPIGQSFPNRICKNTHYTEHTLTGWVDKYLWVKYLANLRTLIPYKEEYAKDVIQNKIFLTCDSFPAHHDERANKVAVEYNIELIPIPKGCTDECQALDRRLFGIVKQKGRAHTSQLMAATVLESIMSNTPMLNPSPSVKRQAWALFISIWENIPKSQIDKAWSLSLYGRENGENEDV